jgi:hypothetical protein
MTELPDNLKDFIGMYLELRLKAYTPCTRAEAVEAGHCRSTHGSNNHRRHYCLIVDGASHNLLRRLDRRIDHMTEDIYYHFNDDLERLRVTEKNTEPPVDQQKGEKA